MTFLAVVIPAALPGEVTEEREVTGAWRRGHRPPPFDPPRLDPP